jgi:hypothetical protein
MVRRLVIERLRGALFPSFQKAWKADMDVHVRQLRTQLTAVEATLNELRRANRRLEVLNEWNEGRGTLLRELDARLSIDRIGAHVRDAIAGAEVAAEPTTHVVVDRVLPDDFYRLLVESIPPPEFFPNRDPVKQDLEMEALDGTPRITQRVWRFFDQQVVRDMLAPAIFGRFHAGVVAHYAESGGPAFGAKAAAIPHRTVPGRVMLRRPGYHLAPHLDPKRVAITGIMYFARPGDSDAYGTQLFRVDRPFVASGTKTFFPEQQGLRCELARSVPFRANTLFAFVNSRAAHGATLPPDAALQERYSYQFYLKPQDGDLKALLLGLPEEQRASWKDFLEKS